MTKKAYVLVINSPKIRYTSSITAPPKDGDKVSWTPFEVSILRIYSGRNSEQQANEYADFLNKEADGK